MPRQTSIIASAIIPAPPDRVWEIACDTSRYPEWVENTLRMIHTDGPARAGATMEELTRIAGPWKSVTRWRVTEFDPPRRQVQEGEGVSHDYVRHGTTTLFAALEAATGKVTGACYPRHRHEEFLIFLRQVAKAYPRRKLHLVVDNYGTHTHPDVRAWLARHPRITLHFTPTSGSWLNMAEVFFSIITRQAIRRGSFTSVAELIAAIEAFIDGWNDRCHPFTWTKTADEILPKCRPGKRTSFTRH